MAEYIFYKLSFHSGVHLGNGMLGSSDVRFCADTLFSALYIEALKMGCEDLLLKSAKEGRIRISDAFPYIGDTYYLPKPMLRIEAAVSGDSSEKKFYKNLKFIPSGLLDDYLAGRMQKVNPVRDWISLSSRTAANVTEGEDTLPYQVGICSFRAGSGLYIITYAESDAERELLKDLLKSLSAAGIGGKRSAGLGRFDLEQGKSDQRIAFGLMKNSGTKLLLSVSLPKEEEMEPALRGASYSVIPRSGFVASPFYAPEQRKKRTLYAFEAGSCFQNTFEGDVYDVSSGGTHSVYRYAKPMFMSLSGVDQ